MADDELDKIMQEKMEMQKQVARLRSLAHSVLEDEAVERLMFIISTKNYGMQLAQQALSVAMQLSSRIGRKLKDEELRSILARLTSSSKKEGHITIHRK